VNHNEVNEFLNDIKKEFDRKIFGQINTPLIWIQVTKIVSDSLYHHDLKFPFIHDHKIYQDFEIVPDDTVSYRIDWKCMDLSNDISYIKFMLKKFRICSEQELNNPEQINLKFATSCYLNLLS